MGREIRKVPPDWEHPIATSANCSNSREYGHPLPLYDKSFREAADEWIDGFTGWLEAGRPVLSEYSTYWWQYHGDPPSQESYREREWTPDEATAFQIYETVSEGTPVSPVFETEDDLVAWVMAEWGHSEVAARKFVEWGSVPSMMVSPNRGIRSNLEMLEP